MLTHRLPETAPQDNGLASELVHTGLAGSVEDFARIVTSADPALARSHIDALCRLGVPLEVIYLELLAPTARHLGYLWEEDLCDFTDVTVGLGTLQQVLRQFGPEFRRLIDKPSAERRALLLPAPGEQHTFGLFMVEEFFRRDGWHARSEPASDISRGLAVIRSEWFDVVGFSLSCSDLLDGLASAIRTVRSSAFNRNVRILVGGNVFLQNPELVSVVRADGTATDGLAVARLFAENNSVTRMS
jgi:methanogenic corrinoid protein MtbC1